MLGYWLDLNLSSPPNDRQYCIQLDTLTVNLKRFMQSRSQLQRIITMTRRSNLRCSYKKLIDHALLDHYPDTHWKHLIAILPRSEVPV